MIALDDPSEFSELAEGDEKQGALDRDVIRRIVRAHLNEVKDCYNAGLATDPTLTGRVVINFVISGEGTVRSAEVAEDSLTDPTVGECIKKAVGTWVFPKPRGGGNVVVTYPFSLVPG